MQNIKIDLKHSKISEKDIMKYAKQVENIHEELHKNKDEEGEFLGWIDLPTNYDKIGRASCRERV